MCYYFATKITFYNNNIYSFVSLNRYKYQCHVSVCLFAIHDDEPLALALPFRGEHRAFICCPFVLVHIALQLVGFRGTICCYVVIVNWNMLCFENWIAKQTRVHSETCNATYKYVQFVFAIPLPFHFRLSSVSTRNSQSQSNSKLSNSKKHVYVAEEQRRRSAQTK